MDNLNAKANGYKVIDEFDRDIASIVNLEIANGKVVKVIDEFGRNIIRIVRVLKNGEEIK